MTEEQTGSTRTPAEDLIAIGLALKTKREELSYTIEHVAEITRITLSSLRAIEEGDMAKLPGLVFVRGFVRNYANLLGLESDWMVVLLNHIFEGTTEGPSLNRHSSTIGSSSSPSSTIDYSKFNLSYLGLAAVGFLAIVIIGFLISDSQKSTAPVAAVQAVQEPTPTTEVAPNPEKVLEKVISPLNLVLVAQAPDWIALSVDGQAAQEIQLEKDKRYEYPADDNYRLVMSTGGTASIYLNGEEIAVGPDKKELLYQAELNKFSLTQQNN